jgi:hypothetical protein
MARARGLSIARAYTDAPIDSPVVHIDAPVFRLIDFRGFLHFFRGSLHFPSSPLARRIRRATSQRTPD